MVEQKTFKFTGTVFPGLPRYETVMDILCDSAVSGKGEKINVVRHMAKYKLSVFNVLGVAVVADYSREPDLYFHMGSVGEGGVKPAVDYIEWRVKDSKLVEICND